MTGKRLFGTDGIRGVANRHPMTPEVALQVGKAVARHFANTERGHPQVVIGKDTRLSGYMLEAALEAGLVSAGATCFLVGPMPTPAVAHITKSFAADAGIMITASHNPASHNGIKLFDQHGHKLSDEDEKAIEALVNEGLERNGDTTTPADTIGKARRVEDARGRYIEYAKGTIKNQSLKGLTIVVDTANGAAYRITPTILEELGATVITLYNQPDGENINKECGATHPEVIATAVQTHKADAGIALDGDADRLIMVDENGEPVDGDHLLAIIALALNAEGRLAKKRVVGTQYTNKGFDEAMTKAGISVERVENGDRYILARLHKEELNLGGEQSGHVILRDYATTGDGTIVALQILKLMQAQKKKLSELAKCMTSWPQRVLSVSVSEKKPLAELPKVTKAIKTAEALLGGDGRVFVRYSGTEAKARVMVEAKDPGLPLKIAEEIITAFQSEVGT